MKREYVKKIRRLNVATHRDLGYFFSSLIIIYCLSGIALNHVNEWNPDFVISKELIEIKGNYTREMMNKQVISDFGGLVGEGRYKIYDFPTSDQVKIYYDNASLHINFSEGKGIYEKVSRRPVFYHSNILHRNSMKNWKWVSDIFAFLLIVINITGLFILKGKHGLSGRGKWLIAAGALLPVAAIIIGEII